MSYVWLEHVSEWLTVATIICLSKSEGRRKVRNVQTEMVGRRKEQFT
jgi:hypothetical protein